MVQVSLTTDDELTAFGRDLGTGTALPTVAGDGSALRRGDVYQHTGLAALMVWSGFWRQISMSNADPAGLASTYSAVLPWGFRTHFGGTDYVWNGTGWDAAGVIVGYGKAAGSGGVIYQTTTTGEERVTDAALNISATLTAGRAYRVLAKFLTQPGIAQAIVANNVRAHTGAGTVLSTDPIVGDDRYSSPNGTGSFARQTSRINDLFTVGATGVFSFAIFTTQQAAGGYVLPTGRGYAELSIQDAGNATAGLVSL